MGVLLPPRNATNPGFLNLVDSMASKSLVFSLKPRPHPLSVVKAYRPGCVMACSTTGNLRTYVLTSLDRCCCLLSLDLPPLDHLPAKVVMDLKSIAQYLISAPGESHTGGQHKNKRHERVKENWFDL